MNTTDLLRPANELVKLGLSRAAELLVELHDTTTTEDQMYRDGVEDALLTLIQAGATDPR